MARHTDSERLNFLANKRSGVSIVMPNQDEPSRVEVSCFWQTYTGRTLREAIDKAMDDNPDALRFGHHGG